ncbi:MAG TPA: hypothetical protein VFD46_14215 [Chryseolinea sp.]|nr:hypothetical protein [Chryseolinea sp.]
METIVTSDEEMVSLVKDGYFFNFCIAFALNKGHQDAIKEKKEVKFSVGDYDVVFDAKQMCFILSHKIYFARIITSYYYGVVFIGDNEDEVINELLIEVEKEISNKLKI